MKARNEPESINELVLAELRLMREQLAALTSELRARKRKTSRRVAAVRRNAANDPALAGLKPTAEDFARARRFLAKR